MFVKTPRGILDERYIALDIAEIPQLRGGDVPTVESSQDKFQGFVQERTHRSTHLARV